MLMLGFALPQDVSFQHDVLPLLADRCFVCHGPDGAQRKAGLRLDEPGDLDLEELLWRLSDETTEPMPPADSGLTLSAAERERLRRWALAGAVRDEHWAFVPPVRAPLPLVQDEAWPRGALDHFVLAKLEREGLAPSPPAAPHELLRRVALDLTGLPPTPAELERFLADPSDAAYAAAVERMLASPQHAERLAWEWLEAARYADTDGYQGDPTRTMWPWRDVLVQALQENVPFDELTAALLAGDELPSATPQQIILSGFLRNHAHNGEGGRIPEETRVENVFDDAETVATVWLGLTLSCARCHDHKYDPLSQEDYFRFYAFFDQTSQTGAGGSGASGASFSFVPPTVQARVDAIERELAGFEAELHAPDPVLDVAESEWCHTLRVALDRAVGAYTTTQAGPWRALGPLPAPSGGERPFAHDYFGAPSIDLADPRWRPVPEVPDGAVHPLSDVVGATYLHRSLTANGPREVQLSLGSDDGLRVWLDGRELLARDVSRGAAPNQETLLLQLTGGRHELVLQVVNTGGPSGVYFRIAEEYALGLSANVVSALQSDAPDQGQKRLLRRTFRTTQSPAWRERDARRGALQVELAALRADATRVLVMDTLPKASRRTTRVLAGGAYDAPRQAVTAGTPAFLPPLSSDGAPERLALARWLVTGANPLTARVAASRVWQVLFGRGLVHTAEDFGRQGDRPSHPELLDLLAVELIASDWDLRALIRSIVLSSTYRQSSRRTPEAHLRDPDNVLLGRGARRRMPAWMLRDQALALSGRLVDRIGGPPVKPYQPEGVWAEATFDQVRYERDGGDALYRRSLYVFWRRIVGPTVFFDAGDRQACSVRRARTDSPLHALAAWNDVGFIEAARGLAERAWSAASGEPRAALTFAFRAATARSPEVAELERLVARYAATRARFAAGELDGAAYARVGDAPANPTIPTADLAAMAVVCSLILNLDEVLSIP